MIVLLDTTVLIDALRSRRERRALLARLVLAGHGLATCAINVAEIYAGMRKTEEAGTSAFLESLDCYPVDCQIARRAGELRNFWAGKGVTLSLADTFVAATALENGLVLATDNRKDFPMPELELYDLP